MPKNYKEATLICRPIEIQSPLHTLTLVYQAYMRKAYMDSYKKI